MNNKIKVSLIIPTRERADTLFYTIKTALQQNEKNFEVIVSDNFSVDGTRQIFDSFKDARLKYVNPGKRLSMTEHWNFAISHARGDYVIFIGDDDGLMPNAIDRFCNYTKSHPSKVYAWPTNVYFWPSNNKPARLHNLIRKINPVKIDLNRLTSFAVRFGLCNYLKLPHLYHSAVHKTVLEEIYKATGTYFKTTIPDVYMSYTIPVFCSEAVDLGESITVVGHSPKSNSGSLMDDKKATALNEFMTEYGEYEIHKNVPIGLSKVACFILDTIFTVRDEFPNYYQELKPHNSAMLAFLCFTLKKDSFISIIKKQKLIKARYRFNFAVLGAYLFFFQFLCMDKKDSI